MTNTTLVTGIWDLNRSETSPSWARPFDHYIDNFIRLLIACSDTPMIIFIDPKHEYIVWENRDKSNTMVIHHRKDQFGGDFFPFFDIVQEIRNDSEWKNQAGWLADSTQSSMEYYNPMVMSKMFLLNNAKIFNPFNTDYLFWIDGGITSTVHPGYFSHDNIIEKIENNVKKFLFVCFPYEPETEIHGFSLEGMKKYCQTDKIDRVARGGFFGGHKEYISKVNDQYYQLLNSSLSDGYMGTEESIFTIMSYLDPSTYQLEFINSDGLLYTFFEKAKNFSVGNNNRKNNDIILYVNTFNTPKQLELLLQSFEKYDSNFLTKTKKYLINNSTDPSTFADYDNLADKHGFEQIKKGNLGVCGGRQLAAEHFRDLGSKYMMFFEDDMLLDLSDTYCPFGFRRNVPNLLNTVIQLMDIEQYDFIKFSFSEFFGNNSDQWAWHNIPTETKDSYFKEDKVKPKTIFKNIKTFNNLPYIDGEVYYSNWPHIIGQSGNQKLFLDTTWERPFEQTWMSHIFSLTKQGKANPALLLASPINHNRVYFYEAEDRKES